MSQDEARIAARYPKRAPVDYLVGAVAAAAILVAIGIVVVTGLDRANPDVAAMVRSFEVVDPTTITAEMIVQRKDPSIPVECKVFAQALTYDKVAERTITVPPGKDVLTSVDVTLKTVKEATSLSVESCRVTT